jgi:hypothetical protein
VRAEHDRAVHDGRHAEAAQFTLECEAAVRLQRDFAVRAETGAATPAARIDGE